MKKIVKARYPEKTSLNLLYSENGFDDPRLPIAVFVVFLLLLGLFVKFMVVDKLAEGFEARAEYESMRQMISELQEQNAEYEEIKAEYSHYGAAYLNDEEKAETDRMEIIGILDDKVLARAKIESIGISGNVVTLTIDRIRLSVVSEIVADLEADDAVDFVSVQTAATGEDQNAWVTASMVINFKAYGGEE